MAGNRLFGFIADLEHRIENISSFSRVNLAAGGLGLLALGDCIESFNPCLGATVEVLGIGVLSTAIASEFFGNEYVAGQQGPEVVE